VLIVEQNVLALDLAHRAYVLERGQVVDVAKATPSGRCKGLARGIPRQGGHMSTAQQIGPLPLGRTTTTAPPPATTRPPQPATTTSHPQSPRSTPRPRHNHDTPATAPLDVTTVVTLSTTATSTPAAPVATVHTAQPVSALHASSLSTAYGLGFAASSPLHSAHRSGDRCARRPHLRRIRHDQSRRARLLAGGACLALAVIVGIVATSS